MSFDWEAYYTLACVLAEQAKSTKGAQQQEAMWRCAISRTYYAAWCLARNSSSCKLIS